jgi:archaellum component FlaC
MGLDFNHTCPSINRSINDFKDDISRELDSMIDECCPLWSGEERDKFIEGYVNSMYSALESHFEDVRSTNEDMRKQADTQIDDLENQVQELHSEISDLEDKVNYLGREVDDLQDQLSEVTV